MITYTLVTFFLRHLILSPFFYWNLVSPSLVQSHWSQLKEEEYIFFSKRSTRTCSVFNSSLCRKICKFIWANKPATCWLGCSFDMLEKLEPDMLDDPGPTFTLAFWLKHQKIMGVSSKHNTGIIQFGTIYFMHTYRKNIILQAEFLKELVEKWTKDHICTFMPVSIAH